MVYTDSSGPAAQASLGKGRLCASASKEHYAVRLSPAKGNDSVSIAEYTTDLAVQAARQRSNASLRAYFKQRMGNIEGRTKALEDAHDAHSKKLE